MSHLECRPAPIERLLILNRFSGSSYHYHIFSLILSLPRAQTFAVICCRSFICGDNRQNALHAVTRCIYIMHSIVLVQKESQGLQCPYFDGATPSLPQPLTHCAAFCHISAASRRPSSPSLILCEHLDLSCAVCTHG